MLVATGIGPVDVVLLMGGRSSWNLFNVAVALILNLVLGLILGPRIGIAGAAVGLAGAILFNNVGPLVEVRAFLKVHPFGPAFFPVAASAALCFGCVGAAARLALGESVPVLGGYLVLGSAGYIALLYAFRTRIELPLLWATLTRRRTT
jgi:O-antigen/teichoic acid export membrane protein